MKKKLAMLCLAGVMVFGLTACGNTAATTTGDGTQVQQETSTDGTVSAEAIEEGNTEDVDAQEQKDEPRVGEREGYIGLEEMDVNEYLQLSDYKNMTVNVARPVVTDEIIESYINSELLVGQITDRPVKEGDVVNIDYVGKKDDVAFDGGTDSGADLEIGSGAFIPGFEEGLVGVNPGETVDLDITFPENYPAEDLAGQPVVFTVTVNSITGSAEFDTATDEDLKKLGLEYASKDELWEAGKQELEQQAELTYKTNVNNAIMQKLYEDNTIENVPQHLVDEEIENYNVYMEKLCTQKYGMELDAFIEAQGMTKDDYNAQVKEMSETRVKQYLIMESVFRAEGIELTQDMILEVANEEAPKYNMENGEALIEDVGYTAYRMYVVQEKVLERLNEIVTVEEPVEENTEVSTEETTEVVTAEATEQATDVTE